MTREEREKAIEIIRKYECNAEHYEACEAIIKASEQGSVLDKIRAEIVDLGKRTMNDNRASGIWACRDIIDKYKEGSEQ